jgi:hypothetical protein
MYGPMYVKSEEFSFGPYDWITMYQGWCGEVFGNSPYDTCIGGGYVLGGGYTDPLMWQTFRVDECRPVGLPEGVELGAEYNGWRIASNTNFTPFDIATVTVYAMFLPPLEEPPVE